MAYLGVYLSDTGRLAEVSETMEWSRRELLAATFGLMGMGGAHAVASGQHSSEGDGLIETVAGQRLAWDMVPSMYSGTRTVTRRTVTFSSRLCLKCRLVSPASGLTRQHGTTAI